MTKTEMTTRIRGGVEGRLVLSSVGSYTVGPFAAVDFGAGRRWGNDR